MAGTSCLDVTIRVAYRLLGGAGERTVEVDGAGMARPAEAARELGLVVRRRVAGTPTWRVEVCPEAPVELMRAEATVSGLGLRGADALFLSGYNSWTDSVERSPRACMRGLAGVPNAVVERWVLDNSGDYRFVPGDPRRGRQHGFGYGYVRRGSEVTLVGSLMGDDAFLLLREDLPADALALEAEVPGVPVGAGQRRQALAFAVATGTLDAAVRSWLRLAGVEPRPARPLVGFSSWYRHYGDISEAKLRTDLAYVSALLGARDLGGCQGVFQVDDGYAKVGDWLAPDAARFPQGMVPLARDIEAEGLMPGIWLAPFLVERESATAAEHPEWLLRDGAGELVAAGGNWSGAWALDTRLPEVRAHIRHFMGVVTREWGYRLLKLDFLYAACLVPHDGLNRAQLMADALDLLRSSVPEGVAFDLCGVPLMSALGRTEYCRIGCDVCLSWDDVPYMRLLHRERVSTRRSLGNTLGRAHLDGLAFRNDPDVFFLRRDVLTDGQRARLLGADARLGGMLLTSDDVAAWDEGQLAQFDAALATFSGRCEG